MVREERERPHFFDLLLIFRKSEGNSRPVLAVYFHSPAFNTITRFFSLHLAFLLSGGIEKETKLNHPLCLFCVTCLLRYALSHFLFIFWIDFSNKHILKMASIEHLWMFWVLLFSIFGLWNKVCVGSLYSMMYDRVWFELRKAWSKHETVGTNC